jgi:hypothetical protein
MLIGLWFGHGPPALDDTRVRENRFSLSVISTRSCQPGSRSSIGKLCWFSGDWRILIVRGGGDVVTEWPGISAGPGREILGTLCAAAKGRRGKRDMFAVNVERERWQNWDTRRMRENHACENAGSGGQAIQRLPAADLQGRTAAILILVLLRKVRRVTPCAPVLPRSGQARRHIPQ